MSTRTRQSKRIDEDLLYDEFDESLDLETLSDEELEEILFEDDEEETKRKGPFNLPTMAGLSMIVVGLAYLLQQLGVLGGISLGAMVSWLPWLAGILIILLGFGVLSWRPDKKKRRRAAIARRREQARRREEAIARRKERERQREETRTKTTPPSTSTSTQKATATASASASSKRASRASSATTSRTTRRRSAKPRSRFRKSHDRKIAGVCGGIAEYFNLDPTLVRIAFVIATIITQGAFFFAYPILALFMAPPAPRNSATKTSKPRSDSSAEGRITIIKDR